MIKTNIQKSLNWIYITASSKKCTAFIIVLFAVQASWIAISNRYPMIIDEGAHFGTIQYYSSHLSPFLSSQDQSADFLGNVARSSSSFYYFLLGLVLAFIKLFTSYVSAQVVILRLLHVLFFAGGLVFVYKSLRVMKLSRAGANFALFLFTLFPITTFMAAHINYDNVLFFAGSINIYLALLIYSKKPKAVTLNQTLLYLFTGIAACLIKFSFLPIFLISLIFLGVYYSRNFHKMADFKNAEIYRKKTTILLALLLLLIIIVGLERYVGNYVRYNSFNPSCNTVLSEKRCSSNQIYQRDVLLSETNKDKPRLSFIDYGSLWMTNMNEGMYFIAVKPPSDTNTDVKTASNSVLQPAAPAFLSTAVWILYLVGIGIFLYTLHLIRDKKIIVFISAIIVFYTLALFHTNHSTYLQLGEPIAIQGRYMLILLPYIVGLAVLGLSHLAIKRHYKMLIALVVLLIFTQGGGVETYIKQSDQRWYFKSPWIVYINSDARSVVNHVIIYD